MQSENGNCPHERCSSVGLVRNAGSIALARSRSDGSGVSSLLITLEDVMQALVEAKA
jgi:hypothetical protein